MPRPPNTRRLSDILGALFFFAAVVDSFQARWDLALVALPLVLQNLLIAVAFLLRGPRAAGPTALRARLVAYAHGFMVAAFTDLSARFFPHWYAETSYVPVAAAGVVLYFFGVVLSLPALVALRHAFSIEPQARELVTTGMYRWARHPIYAAYVVEYGGLLLWHLTVPFALAYGTFLLLMWVRIREEEAVLERAFPEYAAYRARVGMFGPKARRRAAVAARHELASS
ncbi:MAG TPA: isoprenylcysteine carboxylmethyltransferase family protein [Gemmatimonadales bacterium]|nr:isoprenylcysteine carboxylmethyltransferase family protein [Gemmatimonadota bacterium]